MRDEKRAVLRLKNGAEVDARLAYVRWRILESIQRRHPEEMKLLMALAGLDMPKASELPKPSTEARNYLRRVYEDWFEPNGELKHVISNVIRSSVRVTSEGMLLTNPFHLSNPDELQVFLDIQYRDDHILQRLDRLFFGTRDRGGRGHSS